MRVHWLIRRLSAWLCAAVMMVTSVSPAVAGRVDTDTVLDQAQQEIMVAEQRAQVISALEREAVAQRLAEMGVDPEQARERVRRMSAGEIAELHGRMEEAKAGGAHGHVAGIALVVFVVFVITDVLGATDIFPFIQPVE